MSARAPSGLPKPETLFIRDLSAGANVSTSRDAIRDNEAFWMEGLQPVSPGNLRVLGGAADTGMTALVETTDPTYSMTFQIGAVNFVFVVFASSGNGYVINLLTHATSKIFNGTLTSGTTCAAQWNKLGILIVDPVGYWDYGVTVAATLTALDHSVQSVTIADPGSVYTAQPTVTFAGGGGAGAAATAYLGVSNAAVAAGGLGYNVNDIVTVPGTGSIAQASIEIAAVSGAGAATAVQILAAGEYVAGGLPGAAAATTGGSGNGLTINCTLFVSAIAVTNRGSGYTSAPSATLVGGGPPTRTGALVAVVSGSLGGTAIATYAGRSWIANGRTVTFTDAGQYASFIGSSSQFTIDDSYLVNNITALFAANNYLYIFGSTSIDVLSNVTVSAEGTASFSRVNVNPVIGCDQPKNIFGYYRSVAFANGFGFYMLTGATVDNISEGKLDLMTQDGGMVAAITSGFPVTLAGQLCAAWSINAPDPTVATFTSIDVIVIFNKGKWFFARQTTDGTHFVTFRCTVSAPTGNFGYLAYSFDRLITPSNTRLYSLFSSSFISWKLYTKLYEMEAPMVSKQATRAGIGFNGVTVGSIGAVAFAIDSEVGLGTAIPLPSAGVAGYQSVIGAASGVPNNAKFVGWRASLTATASIVNRINWLAMEAVRTNPWQ